MVDATLAKGPENNRKCTDCLFLIVWFIFLGGMLWMTIDGYILGDAAYMLAPIAANPTTSTNVCGYGNVADYQYLYVPDLAQAVVPISEYFNYGYCAKSCPSSSDTPVDCYPNDACPSTNYIPYDTTEILNYCVPTAGSLAVVYSGNDNFATGNFYVSMYESRWVIFTCIWIALAISLIYIKLMDWFAVPLAYVTIVVIEIALCLMGYYSYDYAHRLMDNNGGESTSSSTGLIWTAALLWITAGLYYLIMFCNFKSLRISIAIIETAADWFADTKRIIFVPLIYFSLWICVFVFWLWGFCGVLAITDS